MADSGVWPSEFGELVKAYKEALANQRKAEEAWEAHGCPNRGPESDAVDETWQIRRKCMKAVLRYIEES